MGTSHPAWLYSKFTRATGQALALYRRYRTASALRHLANAAVDDRISKQRWFRSPWAGSKFLILLHVLSCNISKLWYFKKATFYCVIVYFVRAVLTVQARHLFHIVHIKGFRRHPFVKRNTPHFMWRISRMFSRSIIKPNYAECSYLNGYVLIACIS